MRYFFFPLCPLRQVDYFKPKFPGLQEQHKSVPTSPLLSPAHPGPSHPQAGPLCSRPSGPRAALQGPWGLRQSGLPPCRQASVPFCCFVFSANTRTEREARINSQTDTKRRDRQKFRGRSPERWRQGGRMPQMARPLNGWDQVFSHSHTWVECSVGWHSHGRWVGWMLSLLAGCSPLSPSHCPWSCVLAQWCICLNISGCFQMHVHISSPGWFCSFHSKCDGVQSC